MDRRGVAAKGEGQDLESMGKEGERVADLLSRKPTFDDGQPHAWVTLARGLSKMGVMSRRQAMGTIWSGRVKVNGVTVKKHNVWVDLLHDEIRLDGRVLREPRDHVYLALYKPVNVMCARFDRLGRPTVYDYLPKLDRWVFPVGRLDYDSEGLVLLTDHGQLSDRIASPEYHVPKTYRVKVAGQVFEETLEKLRSGMDIGGYITLPAKAHILRRNKSTCWVEITICEGKNRQIRRMLGRCGHQVLRLVRVRVGPVRLAGLKPGQWRYLTEKEILGLKRAARLS
jgi:pseudouridine synthase